jgi:hypothetical protein
VLPELRRRKREMLAGALEEIVWHCVGLLPDKLDSAPANHVATAMGIALDKIAILSGEPTQIIETHELAPDQRLARLREIRARMTEAPQSALPAPRDET